MAKINYFEVNCGVYNIDDKETVVDSVKLQISKRVRRNNMFGVKAEEYLIPVDEVANILGLSEYNPPKRNGDDCSKRVAYVAEYLTPYLDREVYVEEITRGKQKLLTYVEFN